MMTSVRTCIWSVCSIAWLLLAGPAFAQTVLDADAISDASEDLRHILHEQSELRRELLALEQETRHIKQRLASLDRRAELQQELDRLAQQLEQAKSSDDEERAEQLESKIEPLERRLEHLREVMEVEEELDERIDELHELIERLNETEGLDEAHRAAQYLAKTVDRLRKVQEIRAKLNALSEDTGESIRDHLEKQADELEEQIDADDEFVELVTRLFEALEDDREEEVEDLLPEISELQSELENQPGGSTSGTTATPGAPSVGTGELASGQYFITQSWSQEKNFKRPYYVSVPKHADQQKIPVFMFLHGNGGNAKEAMNGFRRHRKTIGAQYIMVFPQGYRESWNIVSERSKADDRGFIEAIVLKLAKFDNVDANNFTIMGASNGAAMVNQLAIESNLPNIRNYISGVSPLNVWQYDGKHFKAKGEDNNYRVVATPLKGKRLMNISGMEDDLVPYRGGPSKVIPAKGGKLAFVDAEESTFVWARQMGLEGAQLARPTRTDGNVEIFSYLDGDVVHCKVNNEGHGATHGVSEEILLGFLQGGEYAGQK